MDKQQTVTIGGRTFEPARDMTVEHDIWLMDHVARAGLDEVVINQGESPEAFVHRLQKEVLRDGRMFPLLAGCLMPQGAVPTDWSPAMAAEIEQHLRKASAARDKEVIIDQVVALLMGFFEAGVTSVMIFQSASPAPTASNGAASP